MMGRFKKYKKYRESGFGWIGEIPSDWEMVRTKFLFSERVQKGFPKKPLLAATQTQGVVKKEDYAARTVTAQKDFHLLKLVKVGDFVISLRSFQGGIEISYEEGIISPAYTIMNPSTKVERNYVKHLFKSKFFILSLNRFVTGIREGQNIEYKKFKNSFLPVPPLVLQKSIANFLDEKTQQINHFIQLKEKAITLLQERKIAIINQVVTKGLDPNVSMRNSGIEWLGDLPQNWKLKKGKYLFKITKRIAGQLGFDVLSITQRGIKIKDIKSGEGQLSMDYSKYQIVEKGDFGMNHMDLITGYVDISRFNGVMSPDYRVFKLIDILNNDDRYFLYLFQMGYKYKIFFKYGQGSSQLGRWRFPASAFKDFLFPVPEKEEQRRIVQFLDREISKIDEAIIPIKKEIALANEYEASIISAAVTGKIDVREYQTTAKKYATA